MSGTKRSQKAAAAASRAQDKAAAAASRAQDTARQAAASARQAAATAREAAAKVQPVAEQVKPLAETTRKAASRGLHRTRVWAAPRIEHTGQVLQDTVAPKVSDMLATAARKIEPEKPRSRRWQKVTGLTLLAAAASALAAVLRKRTAENSGTGSTFEATSMPAGEPDRAGTTEPSTHTS